MVTSLFVLSLALTTWHTLCFRFPIAFRSPQPIRLLKGSERTWFERHIPVPDVVRQPLIYLPGLDGGVSNYSEAQFDALSTKYDCWKLRIRPDDRSTFNDLTNLIEEHILSLPTPPIVLGESFGAVLALYVSGKLPYSRIKQLLLVNPATSLDRTNWSQLVPMIARTGRSYPYVGAGTLLATGIQLEQVLERVASVQKRITNFSDLSRELKEMRTVFEKVSDFFPADTLEWRRKHWLEVGSYLLVSGDVYYRVRAPVLLLMGGSDRLLPSSTEGARLKKLLTRTEVTVVDFPDKGHALLDGSIDVAYYINRTLAAIARTELGDPFDIELPSAAAVQRLQPVVDILTRTTSPVFLHRNGTGQLCAGLGGVPTGLLGRPVLFVGNHQAFGLDLPLLVTQFLQEKGALLRGLAHPVAFRDRDGAPINSSLTSIFTAFGAVPVSPFAYYQLLKKNASILLYPGGAQEAFQSRQDKYTLAWPEKTDFVRLAATMDAIIVPFACIGMADSVHYLMDDGDYRRFPLLYAAAQRLASRLPRPRAATAEAVIPPLALPSLPARNYFLFQQPLDTRNFASAGKAECRYAYRQLRQSVQDGIDTLMELRKNDPYRLFPRRAVYESVTGRKAPFPIYGHQ